MVHEMKGQEMGMLSALKTMANNLDRRNNSVFTYPIAKQRSIIASFREPKDNIERSFNQYKCQMHFNKWYISLLLNLVSLPLTLFYLLWRSDQIKDQSAYDAVFMADGIPDHVIPDELRDEFHSWKIVQQHGQLLTDEDKAFFKRIVMNHPFSWHFLLKNLIKIRMYRFEIESHHPKAIIVCGEYSFTSSLLTDYCNTLGLLHIDVMHGEKLYYMRDSFFSFDRCYIWDKYYEKLFTELRAKPDQFIVCTPRSMRFSNLRAAEKEIDYTYYLGAETGELLSRISDCLKKLASTGARVAVRPHPRYSDLEELRSKFEEFIIENSDEIDIEESILRTRSVISTYSTVLNQAYHNHVDIVLDDISDPLKYEKLYQLKYIILNVDHRLLSEVIGEN